MSRAIICKKLLGWLALGLVGVAVLVSIFYLRRPPRSNLVVELFEGVMYERQTRSAPRSLVIHIVKIDLASPVDLIVTPGDMSQGLEIPARTTLAFAAEFGVQVAINGSFFTPFRVGNFLWDYYPHSHDPVDVSGLAISSGQIYSENAPNYSTFCFVDQRAEIRYSGCPSGTVQALSGYPLLVQEGHSLVQDAQDDLHPRTGLAVDVAGKTVWLVVVDGRQRHYSEGLTLAELAELMIEIGADDALNLDGGGSSTWVVNDERVRVLNAPIHKRIPMWERPVANHLGVYAKSRSDTADFVEPDFDVGE